eukprot:11200824-Lingulodinium_polyedra.AAC.1
MLVVAPLRSAPVAAALCVLLPLAPAPIGRRQALAGRLAAGRRAAAVPTPFRRSVLPLTRARRIRLAVVGPA